jgi:hypothetical protein
MKWNLPGTLVGTAMTLSLAVTAPAVDDYYLVDRITEFPDHYLVELIGRGSDQPVYRSGTANAGRVESPAPAVSPGDAPSPAHPGGPLPPPPAQPENRPPPPDNSEKAYLAESIKSLQNERQELIRSDPSLGPDERRWRQERAREIMNEIRSLTARMSGSR